MIQHTPRLASTLLLSRGAWAGKDQDQKSRTRDLGFSVNARVFEWAGASFRLYRQALTRGGESLNRMGFAPAMSYRFVLPFEARLSGQASLTLEDLSRSSGDSAWMEVLDEEHRIDPTRSFLLDHPGVDLITVRIFNEDRTMAFEEGLDFRLEEVGGFTLVVIPPTSRFSLDDRVLVSYRYEEPGNSSGGRRFAQYQTSLVVFGVNIRHGQRMRESEPLDVGVAGQRISDSERWLSVGTSRATPIGQVEILLEGRHRMLSETRITTAVARGSLNLPAWGSFASWLALSFDRMTSDDLESSSQVLTIGFTSAVRRQMTINGGVDAWRWSRGGQKPQLSLLSHLGVNWQVGKLLIRARGDRRQRPSGGMAAQTRWELTLSRQF